ncbi:hypothetical protein U876_16500 [Aeromonas hydrophila NJ-35]|nr:hypothetical protein V428_07395 [Aeromonas hydrophila subsp. hydrophila AL09-71]AHX68710.1 hypothetical protein V429_07400 [Aeromonas hydrophila pc104A]AJE38652.1 hypothetical protein V469_16100 [Aeromonas hydrophila J-1]AKJ37079.1 hypothetical protein U876_16500 [Aeromonas hydrophila NJ-35]ALQ64383.1 hypothetical protein AS145_16300 [Aeromonas hydrophila]
MVIKITEDEDKQLLYFVNIEYHEPNFSARRSLIYNTYIFITISSLALKLYKIRIGTIPISHLGSFSKVIASCTIVSGTPNSEVISVRAHCCISLWARH